MNALNQFKTNHTKIHKISDPFIPYNKLKLELNNLQKLIAENKAADVKKLLYKLLKSYKSNSKIVDRIHIEQLLTK